MVRVLRMLAAVCLALTPACATRFAPVSPAARADSAAVDGQDPALAGALADLRRRPTGAAHRRVAAELMRLNVLDQAFDHLSQAIKKNGKDAEAFDARARIWREWRMLRPALDDANRAVRLAPASAEARNTLGTILFALGQAPDAARLFTEALALDPTAAWAANNLCYLAFLDGDTTKAESLCRRAILMTPTLTAAHHNLALVYAEADMTRAEAELVAGADAARIQYHLGILHLARRDYARAAAALSQACAERAPVPDACVRAGEARRLAAVK